MACALKKSWVMIRAVVGEPCVVAGAGLTSMKEGPLARTSWNLTWHMVVEPCDGIE